ncbi:MAG: DNA-3-methyladenine glycosylase, partial [Bdellovibrionales bacterium]|nr:DNA-3-methyladenine glycosylase [Bdellovibrionales bacterium]
MKRSFYLRSALEVAPDLIGMKLCTKVGKKITSGMIVEVEAYCGDIDPAAHTFNGPTKRNQVMFEMGGKCYVYFTYGMHYCVNVVTGPQKVGDAVLIRALEPVEGVEIINRRRGKVRGLNLTNGPAKLTQALGIDLRHLGEDLIESKKIWLEP